MWWLPAVSLLAVGMLIYMASALHVLSFSPLVAGRQETARDDAVREALARQMSSTSADTGRAALTVRLQAGEHPDTAQLDVPVPLDARMPGARSRDGERATQGRDRAVFATSGDVADVLAFYRAELATHGWHEVRAWMVRPAQGTPGPGSAVSAFCRSSDLPVLLVGVVSQESGPSEVRLFLDAEESGLCALSTGPDRCNGSPPPMF